MQKGLTPEMQQRILSMPDAVCRQAVTERALGLIVQLEGRQQGDRLQGASEEALIWCRIRLSNGAHREQSIRSQLC